MSSRPVGIRPDSEVRTIEEQQSPLLERAFSNLEEKLLAQGVDPIAIANLTPLEYQTSGGNKGPLREHLLLGVDVEGDGFRDYVWYSPAVDPVEGNKPLTMVLKPGLGEIAETGIGYQTHKELANRNPHANIITHATEGFGPSASTINLLDLPGYGLDRMADRALKLLKMYCPDHDVITVGTSMGTVIIHKLLQANSQLRKKQRINIIGNINFVPAVVEPKHVPKDMLCLFPLMMAIDGAAEISIRSLIKAPRRIAHDVKTLIESKPGFKDVPLIGRFIVDLAKGVPKDEVIANAKRYRTRTIAGTWDPLRQIPMWEEAGVKVDLIHGRGHAMCLKPKAAAKKITAIATEFTPSPPAPHLPIFEPIAA